MATCVPITNNSLGYTLKWNITSGSGGYGTGHLDSNNVTAGRADTILAYTPTTSGTPETYSAPTGTSRWAARVKSVSTTAAGVTGVTWGTDTSSEKFLNVGTGSAVSIVKRTTETSSTGDTEFIQFKASIGSTSAQPTGTYKATVIFTEVDN